ncbi:flavodoxin-dependent (E)-4-hydroxy-3-methylbut-2-enyl-diphosphate synthase [Mollicutes bacterium LVI A0039]|nr:flavodoxin-dependent (E)-4-hydroxy-3-methylbut-2-enyl-diphosphate synthase [Mollicutes bacterium LVI A0039]
MQNIIRRTNTRKVMVGNIQIGGNDQIVLQSMCTTKTRDIEATVNQINELEAAGCQIVRVAVPTMEDAKAIGQIKAQTNVPLVADIHFNYRFALEAIEQGIDKIRINPGNIGSEDRVKAVVEACKAKNVPIRIGVNAGSLEKEILEKHGFPTAEGMVESARFHIQILEKLDFHNTIISLKASDMQMAIEAYEMAAKEFDYPMHIGITEAGTSFGGTIKSAAGLGILIHEGIGNTMRVSLSDNPVEEIKVARELLKNFGMITDMPTLISCPTCGRIEVDMIPIAKELEAFLQTIKAPLKVSLLGCAVNGPGEAKEADVGIACARGEGLLFKKGEIVAKVPEDQLLESLKKEVLILEQQYLDNKENSGK